MYIFILSQAYYFVVVLYYKCDVYLVVVECFEESAELCYIVYVLYCVASWG